MDYRDKKLIVVLEKQTMKVDIYTTFKDASLQAHVSDDTIRRKLNNGLPHINKEYIIALANGVHINQARSKQGKKRMIVMKHGHRMEREIPE